MGNSVVSGKNLAFRALEELQQRLPPQWRVDPARESRGTDLEAVLTAPDGRSAQLVLEVKRQLAPRDVEPLARRLGSSPVDGPISVVASGFLSPRTRELLLEAQLSFLDLTGNSRIVCPSPGLFICTSGLEENPNPQERESRSLNGAIAARIVRLLCDHRSPVGVLEIAEQTGANPGYVSRLLGLLQRQALITRKSRGPVEEVRWDALIRAWARDFNPLAPERTMTFLEPRGLTALAKNLPGLEQYALTGSMAAHLVAPVAPARLATVYVDDPGQAGRSLGLRPAEAGINVMLIAAYDPVVYERRVERQGLSLVAPSQLAADLLNSPGRGPEEAATLLEWMQTHELDWRR